MAAEGDRTVRQGQAHKRAAILTAAKELFVQTSVERTSMDAVAALAAVSKRTVYDYYGDKRGLLLGVVEDAGEKALATLRGLVERHLDPARVRDLGDLEQALSELAGALGESLLLSSDYLAAVRLIKENEALLPELEDHPLDVAHAQVLTDRVSHFARAGLLDAADPDLAAAHFHALTALRVLNEPPRRRAEEAHVRQIMTDGARAFIRAYGTRGATA